MLQPVVCASAILTPQNVAYETERLITEALYHRRPVYMAFPADLANQPVLRNAGPISIPQSDANSLAAATDAIVSALAKADSSCILPGILVARAGLQSELLKFVNASGLPFATMFMAKSVLDEQHSSFIGMYDGKLMNHGVGAFVEGCDCVLAVGTIFSDFNTGTFTANIESQKLINIKHHSVHVGSKVYPNVEMRDILVALTEFVAKSEWRPDFDLPSLGSPAGTGADPITADALYPRWADFFRPDDVVVAETGTASMGLGFARMPAGASFHNQTLWGSIGWATPAAFGAAMAAPDRRVILVTGDGAHQFTVQEISQFARRGLRPIIFVLNNSGYLIERLLCTSPGATYNDVAQWSYSELPNALGCSGWYTARVDTCAKLEEALAIAAGTRTGAYIEVVTDPYAASPLALKLHDSMQTLYKS
jgi:indolepyruvate decarboxylase